MVYVKYRPLYLIIFSHFSRGDLFEMEKIVSNNQPVLVLL